MTRREHYRARRKPARVQVFAPAPAVDVGRAGRGLAVLYLRRREPPRRPARWKVFAPPPVVDVGRAGRFVVYRARRRLRRPQRHRAVVLPFFHTGATPPAPVSGDLRRLLFGIGL